jgi:hypothetical protein
MPITHQEAKSKVATAAIAPTAIRNLKICEITLPFRTPRISKATTMTTQTKIIWELL